MCSYSVLAFFIISISLYSQTDEVSVDSGAIFLEADLNDFEIKEWRQLRYFQAQLKALSASQAQKDLELKNYAKDSLKILKVKLLAIKILDSKDLLEHDIAENTAYYLALLKKLRKSNLKRSEYLFLENKLAFLTTEAAEKKYRASKVIIAVLAFLVVALLFFAFKFRRKEGYDQVQLSPQEMNVRGLILDGKTNKEIANELFISLSTVKTHITNIYSKLKVSGRQELLQKTQN